MTMGERAMKVRQLQIEVVDLLGAYQRRRLGVGWPQLGRIGEVGQAFDGHDAHPPINQSLGRRLRQWPFARQSAMF